MTAVPLQTVVERPLGNKIRLLARAKVAGIAVPECFVLLEGERPEESPILAPAAVRSAFSVEDDAHQSCAGYFLSKLNVSPEDYASSVEEVRDSAARVEGPIRRDVLIMKMVQARNAGVAFLEPDYLDDYVEYVPGLADKLLEGTAEGRQAFSSRLDNSLDALSFGERLFQLLRQVRTVFGQGDSGWDIEWADDGQTCWLLQVRPITSPPRRNEWLTYANIREILPDPPSVLMTDIVLKGSGTLYGYYRDFDSSLPDSRSLIETVCGRPVFNLSLLCETIRWWGLPTSLITDNIGGSAAEPRGKLNPKQLLRKTPVLLKQLWSQLTCTRRTKIAIERLTDTKSAKYRTLEECAVASCTLFTDLVLVMLNLTAALSGPLSVLRSAGVLAEHSRRHRSISTAIYDDLVPLQELVARNPSWSEDLRAGKLPESDRFAELWAEFLKKHGHRGIYESDLSMPRYHENPRPLLQSLCESCRHRADPPKWTWKGRLTAPLWWWCAQVLRTREVWRYESMKCYDNLRREFLRLSPVGERVFQLRLDELRKLDQGEAFDEEFWQDRENLIHDLKKVDLPHTFQRFSPLSLQGDKGAPRWQGIGLTRGRVEGRAWVLNHPESKLPSELRESNVILVARTVDAGWIPTFRLVDAVAVELGGDLSHGSIILRELGFPAITSASGVWESLTSGDWVCLDAERGSLERL